MQSIRTTNRTVNRSAALSVRTLVLALFVGWGSVAAPQYAHAGLFSLSPDKERKMGAEAAHQIERQSRILHGPVADWVSIIGARLASVTNPEFQYTFHVIDDPAINAFCLPGGFVFVNTGLRKVAHTDDELAAVLAHEITHAEEHHYAKQYKKASRRGFILGIGSILAGLPYGAEQALSVLDFSMTQRYSRETESQADDLGMKRMVRAGFNPQGMVTLLQKLSQEDEKSSDIDKWFRDHPDANKRAANAERELGQVQTLQASGDPLVKPAYAPWTPGALQQLAGIAPASDSGPVGPQ